MSHLRHGGGFIKFIATIVLMAILIAVGWTVFSNWGRDDQGNLRSDGWSEINLLDKDSWYKSLDDAKPLVEWSEEQLAAFKNNVWGEGGLLADAEDWLASHKNVSAKATASATDNSQPVELTARSALTGNSSRRSSRTSSRCHRGPVGWNQRSVMPTTSWLKASIITMPVILATRLDRPERR